MAGISHILGRPHRIPDKAQPFGTLSMNKCKGPAQLVSSFDDMGIVWVHGK